MREKFSQQTVVLILISSAIAALGLVCFVMYNNFALRNIEFKENLASSQDDIRYHIDNITNNKKSIIIDGWIHKKGEDILTVNSFYVLRSQCGTLFKVPTIIIERKDVSKSFETDKKNYNWSGLHGYIPKFFLDNEKYTLYILYDNNGSRFLINTGMQL